jgi:ubiquinone/menaquinone biosynthesis C-methylase UbiE
LKLVLLSLLLTSEAQNLSEAVYDTIGKNYNKNRAADPRIVNVIRELLRLPTGSVIADIGAGTGNYANALAEKGYLIKAVEPSEEMRKQSRPNDNVDWLNGTAEEIPLGNASVNGVLAVLAIHHFPDLEISVKEVARICPKGPVVVFTLDPREGEEFWLYKYFPEIARHMLRNFHPLSELVATFTRVGKWSAVIKPFPLPPDIKDKFLGSEWNQPESYLDSEIRQNISPFALASPLAVQRCVSKLQNDLKSGKWDKNYGYLRKRSQFDAGFRFLSFRNVNR